MWGLELDASGGGVKGFVNAATSLAGGLEVSCESFVPAEQPVCSFHLMSTGCV